MDISLRQLLDLASRTPVIVRAHPLLRFRLGHGIAIYSSLKGFKKAVNSLDPLEDLPTIIFSNDVDLDERFSMALPVVNCTYNAFQDDQFNYTLFREFDEICAMPEMLKQSKVPDYIVDWVKKNQPHVVMLLIIDGLSYRDMQDQDHVLPCLVDGPTLTFNGMTRIVGSPPLAQRLFELGFFKRFGFSYWDRHNDLADQLFYTFTQGQLKTVKSFEEVCEWIRPNNLAEKTYIQVVRTGLDGYVHGHRDSPPIDLLVECIRNDIKRIVNKLQDLKMPFLFVMTADHGILWEKDFPKELTVLEQGAVPIRYFKGDVKNLPKEVLPWGHFHKEEQIFALSLAYYRRKLKATEWGCHGGISIYESFVPLMKVVG